MRKAIITVTVVALILSILSTGLIVLLETSSPAQTQTVSGE